MSISETDQNFAHPTFDSSHYDVIAITTHEYGNQTSRFHTLILEDHGCKEFPITKLIQIPLNEADNDSGKRAQAVIYKEWENLKRFNYPNIINVGEFVVYTNDEYLYIGYQMEKLQKSCDNMSLNAIQLLQYINQIGTLLDVLGEKEQFAFSDYKGANTGLFQQSGLISIFKAMDVNGTAIDTDSIDKRGSVIKVEPGETLINGGDVQTSIPFVPPELTKVSFTNDYDALLQVQNYIGAVHSYQLAISILVNLFENVTDQRNIVSLLTNVFTTPSTQDGMEYYAAYVTDLLMNQTYNPPIRENIQRLLDLGYTVKPCYRNQDNDTLDSEILEILVKALDLKPENRYSNCGELVHHFGTRVGELLNLMWVR